MTSISHDAAEDEGGRTGSYERRLPVLRRLDEEWAVRERYRVLTRRPPVRPPVPLLLRPDRGIDPAGAVVRLEVLAAGGRGPVYVDGLAEGQTAFTRVVELREGRAVAEVKLPPQLVGTVWLRAYQFGPWGDATHAERALFVQPEQTPDVSVQLARDRYQPGQMAFLLTRRNVDPWAKCVARDPGRRKASIRR